MTNELHLLRDLIHERTGLFFADGDGVGAMENLLKPRLERTGCASPSAYYCVLDRETGSGEWPYVLAALSKPVSSFRRNREHIKALVDWVLPQLIPTGAPLRIWSAGCATGEEPLAIAMALSDTGWFDRAEIEIHASDASFTAIESARAGVYREPRVRYLSPELRDRYFEPVDEGWRVNRELHARIRWSVTNLMVEDDVAELAASQIIFCRNVFIYFSDSKICQALSLLGNHMPAGGYLFSDGGDHFTSLINGLGVFDEQKIDGISVWRKRVD